MYKIILYTFAALVAIYSGIYHVDSQIIPPYKPFKLKKQRSIISKRLIICKDKKRGMINITFILEMVAHFFLITLSIFLLMVYFNRWYEINGFAIIYRNVLIGTIFFLFGIPGISAVSIHDYVMWKEEKQNETMGNKNKRRR